MKKYIVAACFLTSLFSFAIPMKISQYHTWFLLDRCMNSYRFETQSRVNFVKLLAKLINVQEPESAVLTNEDLVHQGMLVTGLTSLTSPTSAIFCTAIPSNSMALIDIYTDEKTFDRRDIGEVCRSHFNARSHGLAYTLPNRDDIQ